MAIYRRYSERNKNVLWRNELGRKWGKNVLWKTVPSQSYNHLKRSLHMLHALWIQRSFIFIDWLSTYPSCFHFIPRGTAPSFPIWKNFTFLSLKTWLHMAPPFLFHYGSYRRLKKKQFKIFYLGLLIPWVCMLFFLFVFGPSGIHFPRFSD